MLLCIYILRSMFSSLEIRNQKFTSFLLVLILHSLLPYDVCDGSRNYSLANIKFMRN